MPSARFSGERRPTFAPFDNTLTVRAVYSFQESSVAPAEKLRSFCRKAQQFFEKAQQFLGKSSVAFSPKQSSMVKGSSYRVKKPKAEKPPPAGGLGSVAGEGLSNSRAAVAAGDVCIRPVSPRTRARACARSFVYIYTNRPQTAECKNRRCGVSYSKQIAYLRHRGRHPTQNRPQPNRIIPCLTP